MNNLANPFSHPSFANPWSLRVFGVTMAAAESGVFTLQEFQQALIQQIQAHESMGKCIDSDESYYTRWTEALTELLQSKQVIDVVRLQPAEQRIRDALAAIWDDHDHDHDHAPQPVFVESAR
jgi:nitrile hydratase accessory protein